jgi:hypothetical protein
MDSLKNNVVRMVQAGVPEEKIAEYIQQFGGGAPARKPSPFGPDLELLAAHAPTGQPAHTGSGGFFETASTEKEPVLRGLSNMYRPVLEGGGAAGGAIIGGTAGAPTGPGAVATGIAGAGLGYGAGKGLADYLDIKAGIKEPYQSPTEMWKQSGEDVAMGAAFEVGGQAAVRGVIATFQGGKWVFKQIKEPLAKAFTEHGVEMAAGKVLVDNTSKNVPVYARNAAEAAQLEKDVPGLKFTLGQRTGDPNLIKLERAQLRATNAADKSAEQIAENTEVLRRYKEQMFPGKENVDDVIGAAGKRQADLTATKEASQGAVSSKVQGMGPEAPQQTGTDLIDTIDTAKQPIKKAMGDLESQIPDYPMRFDNVDTEIYQAIGDKKLSTEQLKAVERVQRDIAKIREKGETTYTAFGVRRTLNDAIEGAYASGKDSVGAVLTKIKGGIEADLSEVTKLARTGKIAEYQGQAVYPDALASQLEKNSQAAAKFRASQQLDMDTLHNEFKGSSAHMKMYGESDTSYADRLARDYKTRTGKEAPYKSTGGSTESAAALEAKNEQIREVLKNIEPGQDVASAMKAYNEFASTEYFARFSRGAVQRATAKGTEAAGTATRIENIPTLFTTPSGADDLIKAIGQEKAGGIMRGHYSYDLLRNATDSAGEIIPSQLYLWIRKNAAALEKYGLRGDFGRVKAAQAIADDAAKAAAEFELSAAIKVLKADPEKAIGAALGGNNTASAAKSLMDTVKGNVAATRGLQNAFADHVIDAAQTTAKTISGDPLVSNAAFTRIMEKYAPAMEVIYKNEPGKLQALKNMQKAYEIASRNTRSPLGGGSDTAENVLTNLSKVGVLSHKWSAIKNLVKALAKYDQKTVDEVVTRALFDPDYAQVLTKAARGEIPQKELQTVVNRKVVQLDEYRKMRMGQAAAGGIAAAAVDPGSIIPFDSFK